MAKRSSSVVRVNTEEVQGEGSFAMVRRLTVEEMRAYRKSFDKKDEDGKPKFDAFEAGLDLLKTHVVLWDWVDDEGISLSQVKDDPTVVEKLTDTEITVLGMAIRGNNDAIKN